MQGAASHSTRPQCAREARIQARARNIDAAPNHHLAVRRSPDRDELLHAVRIPTLVIHGSDDPLMQLPHGRATADAIPGAKLVVIEGMGHYDWPAPRTQKRLLEEILKHVAAR